MSETLLNERFARCVEAECGPSPARSGHEIPSADGSNLNACRRAGVLRTEDGRPLESGLSGLERGIYAASRCDVDALLNSDGWLKGWDLKRRERRAPIPERGLSSPQQRTNLLAGAEHKPVAQVFEPAVSQGCRPAGARFEFGYLSATDARRLENQRYGRQECLRYEECLRYDLPFCENPHSERGYSCPRPCPNFQRAPVQFSTRGQSVRCCGLESPGSVTNRLHRSPLFLLTTRPPLCKYNVTTLHGRTIYN
jgi:hypothetical protein